MDDVDQLIELLGRIENLKQQLQQNLTIWVIIWGTVFPIAGLILLVRVRKTFRLLVPCVGLMFYAIGWPWLFGTQGLFWIGAVLTAWAIYERRRQKRMSAL